MAAPKLKTKRKTRPKSQFGKKEFSVVTLNLKLEAAIKKDGNEWVAWCIPLDVFSQGDSKQMALTSLEQAVHLWFESCIERNVLDKALVECGFHKLGPGEVVPEGASLVEMKHQPEKVETGNFSAYDYIEVSIPAYIAAQHLPHICASR